MSQLISVLAIFGFVDLQNCALYLGCPWSEMQDCSAIWFSSFSELQNIALFRGRPLDDSSRLRSPEKKKALGLDSDRDRDLGSGIGRDIDRDRGGNI